MDNEQQPGPPVHRCLPCRPVKARGYQQGEPSPYLVSHVLLEELDFHGLVTLAANEQVQAHLPLPEQVAAILSSRRNTSRGHR